MPEQDRFAKWNEPVRRVLGLSEQEALRLNRAYIGTEHMLLGLVREPGGVGIKVLRSLGIEPEDVRRAVECAIKSGDGAAHGVLGLTPSGKRTIALAVDEARRLGHHYVGTEHLLLGLIREGQGIAAQVLASQGINLEQARLRTVHLLDDMAQERTKAAGRRRWPLSRLWPWR